MLTPEQCAEIRERWAAATPGPWWYDGHMYVWRGEPHAVSGMVADTECRDLPDDAVIRIRGAGARLPMDENATAIAAAPADIAALLATVESLRAERDKAAEKWRIAHAGLLSIAHSLTSEGRTACSTLAAVHGATDGGASEIREYADAIDERDRLRTTLAERDAEVVAWKGVATERGRHLCDAVTLLQRAVNYATEDRAVTPRSTRLARLLVEVSAFLARHRGA